MTELTVKVRHLADLAQQQLELLPEKERLEKEVFDLKIAAHNAQVDVESLECFSIRNSLLKLTGKYAELLEDAERQTRSVQSQYHLAAARLANVEAQLQHISLTMPELDGCETQLSELLAEKLGAVPCAEEARQVKALEEAIRIGTCVQKTGVLLEDVISDTLCVQDTPPFISSISVFHRKAESAAQELLQKYRKLVAQLRQQLEGLGHNLEPNEFAKDSLWDFFAGIMVDTRFDKAQQQITQIRWQWKALLPQLEHRHRQARVQWLQALLAAV